MKQLLAALMLFPATVFAQSGWFPQPSGTSKNLFGVSFTDANTGTAVGDSGTILRTTNGGATWTSQTSGTPQTLFGVSFTNADTGTVVGMDGIILRTTNGGAAWTSQTSGTTAWLFGVAFTDADTGTAVGIDYVNSLGMVLRTTNGGATWTSQTSGTANPLNGVSFTDANTGTAVGDGGTILRTTNGGATWPKQTSGMTDHLWGVSFADANTGTVVGNGGIILRTTNGGATWTSQTSGTTDQLRGVSFTDANTGTAVGDGGTILRTTNGGATWARQTSGTANPLNAVSFTDANTGTAVGDGGTILRTTTGGLAATIRLAPPEMIFGDTLLPGEVAQRALSVANDGGLPLVVGDVASTEPAFTVSTTVFEVNPYDSLSLIVQFAPPSTGLYEGWLIFSSNDPAHPVDSLRCEGVALPSLTAALVAYYPFSGNADDASGHGHHGTPEGNPVLTTDRLGHATSAYDFDSIGQCIFLPSSISIAADLSISFWVRTTIVDSTSWPGARFIVDRDLCGWNRDWSVGLGRGGKIEFETGTSNTNEVLPSSVDVNDGVWHHVVIIRDPSAQRKRIYVDGRLDTMSTFDGQPFLNNSVRIGIAATVCSELANKYCPGAIDDIRIYNRALVAEEVQLLYHEGGWPVPRLSSTSPVQNQLNVETDANITVTFDTDVNPATLNNSTFVVNATSTGRHPGVITYDNISRTATYNPDREFAVGEVVTVVLTTGIRSAYGGSLEKAHCIQFTTTVHLGSVEFVVDSTYSFGTSPDYCVSADFDNDGDLDIANTYRSPGLVSVLFNDGDATLWLDSNYVVGEVVVTVCAADLDGDGDIDLATANTIEQGTVTILLNNGNGIFSIQPSFAAHGTQPGSVFLSDLDNDGDVDLIVGIAGPSSLSVFFNDGSAQFVFSINYAVGGGASVHAGDLDNDGDMDLTGGIWSTNSVFVLKNRGDGTFDSLSTYRVGRSPAYVTAADLNADGYLDLSLTNHYERTASVLQNNGNGTFAPPVTYGVGWANYVAVSADLDHDGDLDLTVPNREDDDVSVLLNNGNGTFADQHRFACGDGPVSVTASDLDGDGDLDLVTTSWNSNSVDVLLNQGYTGVELAPVGLPTSFALGQNYPNPFNPSTTIPYEVPERAHVVLTVFNMLGQKVTTLVDDMLDAGYRSAEFAAPGLASGVYLYRLQAGNFVGTKRMLMLR